MTFGRTLTAFAVCGAIAAGAAAATFSPARAFTGEKLAADAKITLTEARKLLVE